jgi:transposase-like protein
MKRQLSLKTGTIYEDAVARLSRALNTTQKTAWFMDHRIRVSLGMEIPDKLTGEVEADETFIGGKARNMHTGKRASRTTGTGGKDKTAIIGILERGGKVRTAVIPNRKNKATQAEVGKHVEAGSALYSDALKSYDGLNEFERQVIDQAVQYVDGKVHINALENFWSLLKRGLSGTYVSVEPFHRFRKVTDAGRFSMAVSDIVGKRLTFNQLTGSAENASSLRVRPV